MKNKEKILEIFYGGDDRSLFCLFENWVEIFIIISIDMLKFSTNLTWSIFYDWK